MTPSKYPTLKAATIAFRIWFFTSLVLGAGYFIYALTGNAESPWFAIIIIIVGLIASVPILLMLLVIIPFIRKLKNRASTKLLLLILGCIVCCAAYGIAGSYIMGFGGSETALTLWAISSGTLSASVLVAMLIISKNILALFTTNSST